MMSEGAVAQASCPVPAPSGLGNDQWVHELFECQAARYPTSVAVVCGDQQLTYQELNGKANQLAAYLRAAGVGANELVGICIARSVEIVIAILGTLKAGAAYVPLDPDYPRERLSYLLADCGARIVLSQLNLSDVVAISPVRAILVDRDWPIISRQPANDLRIAVHPEQAVYCIYTSGSTGTPKGAVNTHRGVANLVRWYFSGAVPGYGRERVVLASSLSFDLTQKNILGPLSYGATLIIPEGPAANAAGFRSALETQAPTRINCAPSAFRAYRGSEFTSPSCTVVLGGEAIDPSLVRELGAKGNTIVNSYGPTECADVALAYVRRPTDRCEKLPLGRPLPNVRVYVLDEMDQHVAEGTCGEICIAGIGVARGYLNRPDLTAARFLPDPHGERGSRLYRTGDRGRVLADGNIEFLGRADHQVKIRGFRVELEEIEVVLRGCAGVGQAVVVFQAGKSGCERLVAYIVGNAPGSDPTLVARLQAHAQRFLPDYMVPSAWKLIQSVPLNPNGKVDRAGFPAADEPARADVSSRVLPRTPTEHFLATTWAELLGLHEVGVEEGFRNLGGTSIQAIEVSFRVARAYPLARSIPSMLGNVTISEYASRVDAALAGAALPPPELPRIQDAREFLLAAAAQVQVHFMEQQQGGWRAYRSHARCDINGPLRVDCLRQALNCLIARHESLRTSFVLVDGQLQRRVAERIEISLPTIDLCDYGADEQARVLDSMLGEELQHRFDTAVAPLIRWRLYKLSNRTHTLLVSEHHFIHDGQSSRILLRDLAEMYSAACEARAVVLPPVEAQYGKFCEEEAAWLDSEDCRRQVSAWVDRLHGHTDHLRLFADRSQRQDAGFRGAQLAHPISSALLHRIDAAAASMGISRYGFMLSAFAVVCSRHGARRRFVIGSGLANRTSARFQETVGMFVNMLPLPFDLEPSQSFASLLDATAGQVDFALSFSGVPAAKIVQALRLSARLRGESLFDVSFSFHDSLRAHLDFHELQVRVDEAVSNGSCKFALNVIGILGNASYDDPLVLRFEYDRSKFGREDVQRLANHYHALIAAAVDDPRAPLSSLPAAGPDEQRQLLDWNDTVADFPRFSCIQQLFESQAEKTPDAVALSLADEHVSYRELNVRSNRLAHFLRTSKVGPDVLVGVCMERSPEMIVALLGILKAGGAYVPLDPQAPAQRRAFMLDASGATLLITEEWLESARPVIELQPAHNPEQLSHASNLAYCMFTSGSSGQSKAIAVDHSAVARLVKGVSYVRLSSAEVFLQAAPIAFDAATFEIWGCLLNGARLVLMPPGKFSIEDISDTIATCGVSILWLTAPLFDLIARQYPAALQGVRQLVAGGDVLPIPAIRNVLSHHPDCQLINGYGPTESTTFASTYAFPRSFAQDRAPIGKPISNTQIYILAEDGVPVPLGANGEIYIGGFGLARGYLNHPGLTAERFVPNPFGSPGSRMYRTGDLGRYQHDGNIEFLGRNDHQVKFRGFRVELGEIEAALRECSEVREAVVVARGDSAQDMQLVAYIVVSDDRGDAVTVRLRANLQSRLPDYMIPAAWVLMDSLPLNPNGKLDRGALPSPVAAVSENMVGRTPSDAAEMSSELQTVMAILGQLLPDARVARQDNVFDVGLHSISLLRFIARCRDRLGVRLRPRDVYNLSTPEAIAEAVRNRR